METISDNFLVSFTTAFLCNIYFLGCMITEIWNVINCNDHHIFLENCVMLIRFFWKNVWWYELFISVLSIFFLVLILVGGAFHAECILFIYSNYFTFWCIFVLYYDYFWKLMKLSISYLLPLISIIIIHAISDLTEYCNV